MRTELIAENKNRVDRNHLSDSWSYLSPRKVLYLHPTPLDLPVHSSNEPLPSLQLYSEQ